MEALCAEKFGVHKDVLRFQTLDKKPVCSFETDVVIRVAFSELNPVDLQKLRGGPQQEGQPVPNPPFIPGYGGSGIVEQVGRKESSSLIGKRVAFLADPSRPGCYAEFIAVDHRLVAEIPSDKITLQEAAAIPLAGCTAYESLVKLGLGESSKNLLSSSNQLLVIGGSGGVGSWAITLAKAWHPKLKVIATGSTKESRDYCLECGADQVFAHDDENLVKVLGGGRDGSVSHILCLTEPTPAVFEKMADLIQPYGTICLVVAGPSIKSLDLGFCFFKAANVVLETVFSSIRTNFKHIVPSEEIADILGLIATGTVRVPLSPHVQDAPADWKDASQGLLDILASGHNTRGKLVMKIGSNNDMQY